MAWTDDEIETARVLYRKGWSNSRIALAIGNGKSRNAVIGIINRRGFNRVDGVKMSRLGNKPPKPKAKRNPAAPPHRPLGWFPNPGTALGPDMALVEMSQSDADVPIGKRVKLLDLDERGVTSCRWPIGDPQTPEFGFCPRDAAAGQSYCEAHCRRATATGEPRRRAGEDFKDGGGVGSQQQKKPASGVPEPVD